LDISKNKAAIEDISVNKIPALESDISENAANIADISVNKIPALESDISENSLNVCVLMTFNRFT
jgi:hypothetical protein